MALQTRIAELKEVPNGPIEVVEDFNQDYQNLEDIYDLLDDLVIYTVGNTEFVDFTEPGRRMDTVRLVLDMRKLVTAVRELQF